MTMDFTTLFTEPLFYKVLIGVSLIGSLSGVVGTYAFLRRKSLVSDAVSHSVLPGICVGFLYSGTKDPSWLIAGSLLTGLISVWFIDYLVRTTKLSEDTAIAFSATFFFALGSVLLSVVISGDNPEKNGLKDYLFGKAATLSFRDIRFFIYGGLSIGLLILAFFRQFKILAFNPDFAGTVGINRRATEFLLSVLTVLTVSLGIQAVGVVLMSALIIGPAATARYWTDNFGKMLLLAGATGWLASSLGVFVSGLQENMPTGPWVVSFLFLFVMISLVAAPKKGWISLWKKRRENRRRMESENVLKACYQLQESGKVSVTAKDLLEKRAFEPAALYRILRLLEARGMIERSGRNYRLTEKGSAEAARVVRLHRLWELYLAKRMNFREDHLHGSAETVEHLLTPEIEAELLRELDFPEADPHNKQIPYE